MNKATNCLLQAQYQVDVSGVLSKDDEEKFEDGPWVTTNPVMKDLLTSNVDIGEAAVDKRTLTTRNKINWRNWSAMVTIQAVGNCGHVSTIYPQSKFSIPTNEVEKFGDHNLSHFHVGKVAGEYNSIALKRRLFRQRICQNPKLGHYCAWKRVMELVQPKIYKMFKGGVNNNAAYVHSLIPSDDEWKSTPALTQDRVFKTLADKFLKVGCGPTLSRETKQERKGTFLWNSSSSDLWWCSICLHIAI